MFIGKGTSPDDRLIFDGTSWITASDTLSALSSSNGIFVSGSAVTLSGSVFQVSASRPSTIGINSSLNINALNDLALTGANIFVSGSTIDVSGSAQFKGGSFVVSASAIQMSASRPSIIGINSNLVIVSLDTLRLTGSTISLSGSRISLSGSVYIKDTNSEPPTPTTGIAIYADDGAGKAKSRSGTISVFAAASPECERCGIDYVIAASNPTKGWDKALCVNCLMKVLDKLGISRDDYMIWDKGP